MNYLQHFVIWLTLALSGSASFRAVAQDYPEFYLRGTQTNWACEDAYKFTRTGARYYLHVKDYQGECKIGEQSWNINYGAADYNPETWNISEFGVVNSVPNGPNWNYVFPEDREVTISFIYNKSNPGKQIKVEFLEGFITPSPAPDPIEGDIEDGYAVSGTLPVLYINVYTDSSHSLLNNEILDKDLSHKNYFSDAEYWLDTNGCEWMEALGAKSVGSKEEPLPLEIKARGNYTRTGFSKKPFKLKLGKKQNLLNLTPEKSKHYAILAHADDTDGYLRNFTGFNLGKRIGLPWTPGMQPIEVVINGNYRGLYFLTESIRVGDGRVMIEELDDNVSDPALISGGYLVELDNYDEENQIRFNEKPYSNGDPVVRVTFDTPEEYSSLQYQFIEEQFNAINDNIGDYSDNTWRYLDLDDAARYYIVEELLGHTESFHGSTYLFRDKGEGQKWHFSPLWDCGNAFKAENGKKLFEGWTFGNTWVHSLVKNNKFNDKVKETWKWMMSNNFSGLFEDMEVYCRRLEKAAAYDYERWHNAPQPNSQVSSQVCDNREIMKRFDNVRNYLQDRISYLKNEWGNYGDAVYSEPERDKTPAAELPEYITSGVEEIDSNESVSKYFTIEGIQVDKPSTGLFIEVKGNNAVKILK